MSRYLVCFVLLVLALPSFASEPLSRVPDFSLTERNGATVSRDSLRGKVWVASFVLTRCPDGKCPQVSATVQRLQGELASRRDVRLVTFTVDPEHDSPEVFAKWAEQYGPDADRWLFLTGSEEQIEALMKAFYQPGTKDEKSGLRAHLPYLFVVGREGEIISYHDGLWDTKREEEKEFERNLLRLRRSVDKALQPNLPAWMPTDFPAFNALLNSVATLLLLIGYWAIRLRQVTLHVVCMVLTILVSAVFLASYLFFHLYVKEGVSTRFADQAPDAPALVAYLYYGILLSHTLLAIVATPAALYTAWLGISQQWSRHVWFSRWVFPVWLYVCVTGVVVYWMLYRLYPVP